jgi:AraC-like DNA-binding protein
MSITMSTADVEPSDRLDFWADVVERVFFPVSFQPSRNGPFNGRISVYKIGQVTIARVASEPTILTRTATSIAKFDPEALHLLALLRGRVLIDQNDQTTPVSAGQMVLYDTSHPFSIVTDEPFEAVTIETPRMLLGTQSRRDYLKMIHPVPGDLLAGVVLPFLFGFADRAVENATEDGHEVLGDAVLDVVRSLYFDRTVRPSPSLHRVVRLDEVKAYIDGHLGEDLHPPEIARAHYISVRSLQKLFQSEGLTVSEWIRSRRLACARRDLLDAALADESIGWIAMRWGMPNPAHFSRAFRAEYGMAPSQLREYVRQGEAIDWPV